MSEPSERLRILTMNIGNPSLQRAERQLEWLQDRAEDVLVLTESAPSGGCDLIAERFSLASWELRYPRPAQSERGVLVLSRARLEPRGEELTSYLPARAETVTLAGALIEITGVYVPSRDESSAKIQRKRSFVAGLARAVAERASRGVLIGDLNVLEPEHRPRYGCFHDWEYEFYRGLLAAGWVDAYRLKQPDGTDHSWVGYGGDGFRYDHAFVSTDIADQVTACAYLHETRDEGLTDHSALTLELEIAGHEPLAVEDSLTGEQRTLF